MKLIFLGAPGAGKGTQAEYVSAALNIPTVSTGNIIREALAGGTEMGLKAKAFIEAGKLVPDEVVIGIIKDRLAKDDCANGFILDGFPRTIPQAEALDAMGIAMDSVIDIEVPDDVVAGRMTGRRVCPKCGTSYHVETKRPKVDGVCDYCGAELVVRKDDAPETVQDRLRVYHEQTEPLKTYYENCGKLRIIDGTAPIGEITTSILQVLEAQA